MKNIAKVCTVLGISMIVCDIIRRTTGMDGELSTFMACLPLFIAMLYGCILYLDSAPKMVDIDHARRRQNIIESGFRKGYSVEQIEYMIRRVEGK